MPRHLSGNTATVSNTGAQLMLLTLALLLATRGTDALSNDIGLHSTRKASEKQNDLKCYTCRSMEDGHHCIDLGPVNNTHPHSAGYIQQCKDDRRICMIKRYSYTTSTEDSTSESQLWALERNCTAKCEPGCIIIGERTKLYACTACCEKDLCNIGTGGAPRTYTSPNALLILTLGLLAAFNLVGV